MIKLIHWQFAEPMGINHGHIISLCH